MHATSLAAIRNLRIKVLCAGQSESIRNHFAESIKQLHACILYTVHNKQRELFVHADVPCPPAQSRMLFEWVRHISRSGVLNYTPQLNE